jgi:hypothetical protein
LESFLYVEGRAPLVRGCSTAILSATGRTRCGEAVGPMDI